MPTSKWLCGQEQTNVGISNVVLTEWDQTSWEWEPFEKTLDLL